MTASARLKKAHAILDDVLVALRRSISLEALYARCAASRDILDTMSNCNEGHGFVVIHDAVHRDLIVVLMAVLERGQDRSSSIGALLKILADPDVFAEIRHNPRSHPDAERLITSAHHAYEALHTEEKLKSLRKLRDKVISHIERGDVQHGAKAGDERQALLAMLAIVNDLAAALRNERFWWKDERKAWASLADAFWSHVAWPQEWRAET